MNAADKRILTMRQWPFMNVKDTSVVTTASTQFKEIPSKIDKVKNITVTVSSTVYTPKRVDSEDEWNRINQQTYTSDIPEFYFVRGRQFGLFPIPATSSNTVTIYGRQSAKDLLLADYTTGTISALTNGATAVTGSGTTWTAPMVGRYIKFTESDTAGSGDGFWYEIASRSSNTAIALTKPYAGVTITSSNYIIGQMAPYPEGYHELPVHDAVRTYFASIQPDLTKFKLYDQMYKEMLAQLVTDFSESSSGVVLDDGGPRFIENPNLYARNLS